MAEVIKLEVVVVLEAVVDIEQHQPEQVLQDKDLQAEQLAVVVAKTDQEAAVELVKLGKMEKPPQASILAEMVEMANNLVLQELLFIMPAVAVPEAYNFLAITVLLAAEVKVAAEQEIMVLV